MSALPSSPGRDPIRPWFEALEELGDYSSFKFGHVAESGEVRWHERSHKLFDGIGGFADILQEAKIVPPPLPQNKHPSKPSWWPFVRALPALLGPRRRLAWASLEKGPAVPEGPLPDPVLGWHLFDEDQSVAVREAARALGVTINSYLLKHLDAVIRKELQNPKAATPWMLPVNLRSKVKCERETENQSSYLAIQIAHDQDVTDLHADIHRRLDRGEHWAAWKGYSATRPFPPALKKWALAHDRAMTQWNLGLFTNLGNWDPDKTITDPDYSRAWVVRATVLRSQMIGAACISFQGRLSLSVQVHPDLTTAPSVPERWMKDWVQRISSDLTDNQFHEKRTRPAGEVALS